MTASTLARYIEMAMTVRSLLPVDLPADAFSGSRRHDAARLRESSRRHQSAATKTLPQDTKRKSLPNTYQITCQKNLEGADEHHDGSTAAPAPTCPDDTDATADRCPCERCSTDRTKIRLRRGVSRRLHRVVRAHRLQAE